MNFDDFQENVLKTYFFVGETEREERLYLALAACAEIGEMADEIKKMLRDEDGILSKERLEKIKSEMGDALFYMAILAKKLGFNFSEAANAELNKLSLMIAKWEMETGYTFDIKTYKQLRNKVNK